jgi:hypothetical protein
MRMPSSPGTTQDDETSMVTAESRPLSDDDEDDVMIDDGF